MYLNNNALIYQGVAVSAMQIFIIRAALGVVFGVFISRIFYPQAPIYFTIGLCVVLVGLAYLTQYLRGRK